MIYTSYSVLRSRGFPIENEALLLAINTTVPGNILLIGRITFFPVAAVGFLVILKPGQLGVDEKRRLHPHANGGPARRGEFAVRGQDAVQPGEHGGYERARGVRCGCRWRFHRGGRASVAPY